MGEMDGVKVFWGVKVTVGESVTVGEGVSVGAIVLVCVGLSVKVGVFVGAEEFPDWVAVMDDLVLICKVTSGCVLQAKSVKIETIVILTNQ